MRTCVTGDFLGALRACFRSAVAARGLGIQLGCAEVVVRGVWRGHERAVARGESFENPGGSHSGHVYARAGAR